MRLREVVSHDSSAIVELLRMLRCESPEYEYVDDDPVFVDANLYHMLLHKMMVGVVAETENGIVGFMIGFVAAPWYSRRKEAMEQLLYVDPAYRGGSVAMRLIREFEDVCRDYGAKVLSVGASTGMNEDRTVRLYERMGYTKGSPTLKKVL